MANSDKNQPQDPTSSIDDVVSNINRQREEEFAKKKAAELGLAYRNMSHFQPDPTAVSVIPKELAASARIFSISKQGGTVELAVSDPDNEPTVAALKKLSEDTGHQFAPVLVSESSMDYLLSLYDTFAPGGYHAPSIDVTAEQQAVFKQGASDLNEFKKLLAATNTSDLLDLIFAGATQLEASDIHLEPTPKYIQLRYRLDGVLHDVAELPLATLESINNRIKILADLKLNITEAAQDGRFSIIAPNAKYDVRVSLLPTQYGESAVMRLLPQESKFVSLDALGLNQRDRQIIDTVIHQPNGLVLNTGPTGSGKTTTLYAILNTINTPDTKIITVEDPIEYRLAGVTQTQVDHDANYDFATALRAIVRQDPDIILVGEIRDNETADIAVDASLTGHLVLSTLHTNDAAGAIPRLTDLGAKPPVFADALRLVIAQRLARRVCPACFTKAAPTETDIQKIRQLWPEAPIPAQVAISHSCDKCNGTGYKGRVGLFEVLEITSEIKARIAVGDSAQAIRELATKQGMTTLAQDGVGKLAEGVTTIDELLRIAETR
ncbi:MAG: GspE/PulE family protein [bacterium]